MTKAQQHRRRNAPGLVLLLLVPRTHAISVTGRAGGVGDAGCGVDWREPIECAKGLSCHDDICYDTFPRSAGETCFKAWHCEDTLACDIHGSRICVPKRWGDPCGQMPGAGDPDYLSCGIGLSCTRWRCYHDPRQSGEPCAAAEGLECAGWMVCKDGVCKSSWERLVIPLLSVALFGIVCVAFRECFVWAARALMDNNIFNYQKLRFDDDSTLPVVLSGNVGIELQEKYWERTSNPPSGNSPPLSYHQWKDEIYRYGHVVAPSKCLTEPETIHFQHDCPFDVFLIHTGAQKEEFAESMRERFESKNLRTFLDKNMNPNGGSPVGQMQQALESCRYAVVVISQKFLSRPDPCAELEYAFRRHEWIKENLGSAAWESLRIILFDISVEDYKYHKANQRPSLPDLGSEIVMYQWKNGTGDFGNKWADLCHAVKADLVVHDTQDQAFESWRSFCGNWDAFRSESSSFPNAEYLYSS